MTCAERAERKDGGREPLQKQQTGVCARRKICCVRPALQQHPAVRGRREKGWTCAVQTIRPIVGSVIAARVRPLVHSRHSLAIAPTRSRAALLLPNYPGALVCLVFFFFFFFFPSASFALLCSTGSFVMDQRLSPSRTSPGLDAAARKGSSNEELVQRELPDQSLPFLEQVRRLSETDQVAAGHHQSGGADDDPTKLAGDQPEILVAYLAGEPEAVAAIELLREAQRVWNERKKSNPTLAGAPDQLLKAPADGPDGGASSGGSVTDPVRRYSHEDLRIAYNHISTQLIMNEHRQAAASAAAAVVRQTHPAVPVHQTGASRIPGSKAANNYRRRASSQVDSLGTGGVQARYQKNPAGRKRGGSRQEEPGSILNPTVAALMTKRTSVPRASIDHDRVSQAMTTAGMASRSGSLAEAESAARRTSRVPHSTDEGLVLGAEAANFHQQQRRRASSKASAIFLSAPGKETQLVPEPEDEADASPEERRRRRTISIIATVGAFLLVISILLVTVTLRLATHIDDLGKNSRRKFGPALGKLHQRRVGWTNQIKLRYRP